MDKEKTLMMNPLQWFFLFVSGCLLLLWVAFYNGYPVTFTDSIYYIKVADTLAVRPDRPVGYSLLIRLTQFYPSLWNVVIFQSMVTCYLLMRIACLILPGMKHQKVQVLFILIGTVVFSSVSKFVSWIMADILASWIFLGIVLYILARRWWDKAFAALAVMMAVMSHNSHILLAPCFLLCAFLAAFLLQKFAGEIVPWKKILQISCFVIMAYVLLTVIHFALTARFDLLRGGSGFMLNRLHESGVLTKVLTENCPTRSWKLCRFQEVLKKNQLRGSHWFLWNVRQTPFYETGGWTPGRGNQEQQEIFKAAFECCSLQIARDILDRVWEQLGAFKSVTQMRRMPRPLLSVTLRHKYRHELPAYHRARQHQQGDLKGSMLGFDEILMGTFFLGAGTSLVLLCYWVRQRRLAYLLIACFLFLFLNAAVIGVVAPVRNRHQARIIWLVPYCVFLTVAALRKRLSFGEE